MKNDDDAKKALVNFSIALSSESDCESYKEARKTLEAKMPKVSETRLAKMKRKQAQKQLKN